MSASGMYSWGEVLVGSASRSEQDAREFYEDNWVQNWGLAGEHSKTPDGAAQGFDLTRLIRQANRRFLERSDGLYAVEKDPSDPARGITSPADHDDYGVVRRVPANVAGPGWRKALAQRYGNEDIFKAAHALQQQDESGGFPQYDKVVKSLRKQAPEVEHDVPTMAELDLDDPEDRAIALSTTEEIVAKANITESTVSAATPIIIDPDLFNTVRTLAPHTQFVSQVVQAGFTASYNVISARSTPIGYVGEGDAMDLSNNTPQDFTLVNADTDMQIYVDLVDVSDFAQRAESSLGFMDLFGTSVEQRVREAALFDAQAFYYGDNSQGKSDGSVEDTNAVDGLRTIASDANGSFVKSKTSTSLDGDKALFKDIKAEINALVLEEAVSYADLHITTSLDVFDAMENEAGVNVRLDTFDGPLNFGGRTLSIASVPVTPDPNIRNYSGLTGTTTAGDVFIFDTRAVQDRTLAPLSTMPLGRVGLGDRAALFKYHAFIDRSQGQHTRVLQDYQVSSLPTV